MQCFYICPHCCWCCCCWVMSVISVYAMYKSCDFDFRCFSFVTIAKETVVKIDTAIVKSIWKLELLLFYYWKCETMTAIEWILKISETGHVVHLLTQFSLKIERFYIHRWTIGRKSKRIFISIGYDVIVLK